MRFHSVLFGFYLPVVNDGRFCSEILYCRGIEPSSFGKRKPPEVLRRGGVRFRSLGPPESLELLESFKLAVKHLIYDLATVGDQ